jgi:hypothetical protein
MALPSSVLASFDLCLSPTRRGEWHLPPLVHTQSQASLDGGQEQLRLGYAAGRGLDGNYQNTILLQIYMDCVLLFFSGGRLITPRYQIV